MISHRIFSFGFLNSRSGVASMQFCSEIQLRAKGIVGRQADRLAGIALFFYSAQLELLLSLLSPVDARVRASEDWQRHGARPHTGPFDSSRG